jgi:uncharacterized protein (TIGR02594 family)
MSKEMVDLALSQYGISEVAGDKHNQIILNYFNEIGHTWVTTDETAWCSAFMNWIAMNCNKERSEKLNARSWLKIGAEVQNPGIGDVVVFWRESKDSWKGHVGMFINEVDGWIFTLGGNQNNQVCIKAYPKSRLLGYRRLGNIV